MAGYFEIVDAPDGGYRFRLFEASGRLLGVSARFPTKRDAVAGITAIREVGATGLIRDLTSGRHGEPIQPRIKPARTAPWHNGAHHFHSA
ncbi:MAG TPA: DUF1508 domain-containing protein [Arthrobacter sp.]|jgi:uncharacterized protein YegP (UPF0339 family)